MLLRVLALLSLTHRLLSLSDRRFRSMLKRTVLKPNAHFHYHFQTRLSGTTATTSSSEVPLRRLSEFALADNTLLTNLVAEDDNPDLSPSSSPTPPYARPRQVPNAHYSLVRTESVPSPRLIAASDSCAVSLGLNPAEMKTTLFAAAFAGNHMLPGLDKPYSTNYGILNITSGSNWISGLYDSNNTNNRVSLLWTLVWSTWGW